MKIKQDFITNSSSCSYIVCIPDVELFIKQIEEEHEITNDIKDCIRGGSGYMCFYSMESYDDFYNKIHPVAKKEGYIIMFDENGPENDPQYLNIGNKEQLDKIKKILGYKNITDNNEELSKNKSKIQLLKKEKILGVKK